MITETTQQPLLSSGANWSGTGSAHMLSVDMLYAQLVSSPAGLTDAEAATRLDRVGKNELTKTRRPNWLLVFSANFVHVMAILLWVAGAVAFIAQMPAVGIAIWMVNIINGLFSYWQEFKAEHATEALQKLLPKWATVIRQGNVEKIAAELVVPGDILVISAGDSICADARIIEQSSMTVDQSTLTGESLPVRKTTTSADESVPMRDAGNMVFAGCNALSGHGKALVVATGQQTLFGSIAKLAGEIKREKSPLEREMNRISRRITVLAVGIGLVMFSAGTLFTKVEVAEAFIFALGMIVAFVPEGMVPTVTLSLALAVEKMASANALVKKLSAVETLGCTTVICTDKTGTLTQNEMTARHIWLPDSAWKVRGSGYSLEGSFKSIRGCADESRLKEILMVAALCNDASFEQAETDSRLNVFGDSTEVALVVLCSKAGLDWKALRESNPRLGELPFDRERKRMSTVHLIGGKRVALIKGAPQELIRRCDKIHSDGKVRALNEADRKELTDVTDSLARAGLRVLAFGRHTLDDRCQIEIGEVEKNIELIGLIGLFDPPRPEVREAVHRCHKAGIRVVMFTGDYGLTAESVARHADMLQEKEHVIVSGTDLDALTDDQLEELLAQEVIFARVSPKHKLRLVKAFQKLGHVVAVTGDGVNDAPALKQSNIGIAMGKRGTDVARAAADIILLDDNFASIIKAVELGRTVYTNIRKFATYVFTSNMAEAVPFAVMLLSMGAIPLPLTVIQVLAVDLGTDMVPALGLGCERPEPGCMQEKPRSLIEPLLSAPLLVKALLWYGAIESVAGMSCYFFANWMQGWPTNSLATIGSPGYYHATTMTLLGIVATQIGVVLCCRSYTVPVFKMKFASNRLIMAGIAVELLLIGALMYLPPLQHIFSTSPLSLPEILFALAWTFVVISIDDLRKCITSKGPASPKAHD